MSTGRSAANHEPYALPLTPDREQPTPIAELAIYSGTMSASANEITLDGTAAVDIRWTPAPALVGRVDFAPGTAENELEAVISGDPNADIEIRVPGGCGRARRRAARTTVPRSEVPATSSLKWSLNSCCQVRSSSATGGLFAGVTG